MLGAKGEPAFAADFSLIFFLSYLFRRTSRQPGEIPGHRVDVDRESSRRCPQAKALLVAKSNQSSFPDRPDRDDPAPLKLVVGMPVRSGPGIVETAGAVKITDRGSRFALPGDNAVRDDRLPEVLGGGVEAGPWALAKGPVRSGVLKKEVLQVQPEEYC